MRLRGAKRPVGRPQAAAGGAWLGLILMSLAVLYRNLALWEDLLAGIVAGTVVLAVAVLCGRVSGRLPDLQVVLVAAVAALNVAILLYLFGDWICQAPPAFTECRIPDPLGGISFLDADLLASSSILMALLGAS